MASWLTPLATTRSASMSRPESVSSRIASVGSSSAICRISLRFFSPPEKPSLTLRSRKAGIHVEQLHLLAHEIVELERIELVLAALRPAPCCRRAAGTALLATPGISTGYWKPRNTPARARSSGVEFEQVLAFEQDRAAGHRVRRMAGQHLGERALARAVRPHDRVHFARADREVDALEDLDAVDASRASPRTSSSVLPFCRIIRRFLRA